MTLNISDLRRQADQRLQSAAYNPQKLILIHTAIGLGASLAMAFLSFLFSLEIENTGGLSGMGTRSILSTIQVVLEFSVMILMPFWNIGLCRAALGWYRNERTEVPSLLEGFRRFGSVLGQKILVGGLFMIALFLASQISSTLYMLTPFAQPLLDMMNEMMTADPDALITQAYTGEMLTAMIPLFIISGVLFAGLAIPLFYRTRFADLALMDGNRGPVSVLVSFRITKGKMRQIFKLDLWFWWFYLLQFLTVVLCYADTILALAGVALPMSADASFFLFYILGSLAQLLLLWQYQAKVSATYDVAYHTLLLPDEPQATEE